MKEWNLTAVTIKGMQEIGKSATETNHFANIRKRQVRGSQPSDWLVCWTANLPCPTRNCPYGISSEPTIKSYTIPRIIEPKWKIRKLLPKVGPVEPTELAPCIAFQEIMSSSARTLQDRHHSICKFDLAGYLDALAARLYAFLGPRMILWKVIG